MSDQLFQYHVDIFQEFSDKGNIFQVSTDGGPEFSGEDFVETGESFEDVFEERGESGGHEESVELTEEFTAGNKEFLGEELFVGGEKVQDVEEGSLQFSGDEFADLLESFVELGKEAGKGFGKQLTETLSKVVEGSSIRGSKFRIGSAVLGVFVGLDAADFLGGVSGGL